MCHPSLGFTEDKVEWIPDVADAQAVGVQAVVVAVVGIHGGDPVRTPAF